MSTCDIARVISTIGSAMIEMWLLRFSAGTEEVFVTDMLYLTQYQQFIVTGDSPSRRTYDTTMFAVSLCIS